VVKLQNKAPNQRRPMRWCGRAVRGGTGGSESLLADGRLQRHWARPRW
jgi:hypothetical protein